ncbi:MAG: FHA domain-containing protein [Pseudomonadota bacterium]
MAKIIISSEGMLVREVELKHERITIGRRAHNNIVLDHRSVSGEHAAITLMLDDAVYEDLGSTNGSMVNGHKIFRHKLVNGDRVTMGTFELYFSAELDRRQVAPLGRIHVLNGVHAGKSLALDKPLTTVGKPGAAVMAVTFVAGQYRAARIDGDAPAWLNGRALDDVPRVLADGDQINLAGTKLAFFNGA